MSLAASVTQAIFNCRKKAIRIPVSERREKNLFENQNQKTVATCEKAHHGLDSQKPVRGLLGRDAECGQRSDRVGGRDRYYGRAV